MEKDRWKIQQKAHVTRAKCKSSSKSKWIRVQRETLSLRVQCSMVRQRHSYCMAKSQQSTSQRREEGGAKRRDIETHFPNPECGQRRDNRVRQDPVSAQGFIRSPVNGMEWCRQLDWLGAFWGRWAPVYIGSQGGLCSVGTSDRFWLQ